MEDYILVYDWTPVIRVSDGNYPMFMPQVRAAIPQTSFPIPIRDYILEPFGYKPVIATSQPVGDVITESTPELRDDGKYYQTWEVRDYTEEELASILASAKVDIKSSALNLFIQDLASGIPYQIEGEDVVVGCGDSEVVYYHTLYSVIDKMQSEENIYFMFLDGTHKSLSKGDIVDLLDYTFKKIVEIKNNYWAFLVSVDMATTTEGLPDFPDSFKRGS